MRHLEYLVAALLVAASLTLNGLISGMAPPASATASAAPAARGDNGLPDYFPDRFRDVKVWDVRPQPEAF